MNTLSTKAIQLTLLSILLLLTSNIVHTTLGSRDDDDFTVVVDTVSTVIDGHTTSVEALKNNRGADGLLSFLEALLAIQNSGSGYTINFVLTPGATITLAETHVMRPGGTVIDGDVDGNGTPDIVIDGPNGFISLIVSSANNTLRNLVITGLSVEGVDAHDNLISGNYIGTDVNGTASRMEAVNGVQLLAGAHDNFIEDNIIAGNQHADPRAGILLTTGSAANHIVGNWIGIGVDGVALPNDLGISINGAATGNQIGGSRSGNCSKPCNVISGNLSTGIMIAGSGTTANRVQGNVIGSDPTGAYQIANGANGVAVQSGATHNAIGGARATAGCQELCNMISGNTGVGVLLTDAGTSENSVVGNYIGVRADGQALGNSAAGVWLWQGAANNTIGGERDSSFCDGLCNVIGANSSGVVLRDAATTSNSVVGNYIGVNPAGTVVVPNTLNGVEIGGGASNNQIGNRRQGTTCDGFCNLLSGNGRSGVLLWGSDTNDNVVQGNAIGANATATAVLSNAIYGIEIDANITARSRRLATESTVRSPLPAGPDLSTDAPQDQPSMAPIVDRPGRAPSTAANRIARTQIGGSDPELGNVIGGNRNDGIALVGSAVTETQIQGNIIGADFAGNDVGIGNGANGIFLFRANKTMIGGDDAADANRIAFNRQNGVLLIDQPTTGNTIRRNQIYHNVDRGIRIASSAQQNVKPPAVLATMTEVRGEAAPANGTIDVYVADQARAGRDEDGYAEGMRWIGSGSADSSGNFNFTISGVTSDDLLTVTATDAAGNTSAFSYAPLLIGIEVTQSIQDLRNSVLLIHDKPTVVRAHIATVPADGRQDRDIAFAQLAGELAGLDFPESPLQPGNVDQRLKLHAQQFRGLLERQFFFEIPTGWQSGTVDFELQNLTMRCAEPANAVDNAESADSAHDCRTTVRFIQGAIPDFVLIPLWWQGENGVRHEPDQADLEAVIGELEATYPVQELYWRVGQPIEVPNYFAPFGRSFFLAEVLDLLVSINIQRALDGCGPTCPTFYLGVVDDRLQFNAEADNRLAGVGLPFFRTGLALFEFPLVVSHEVGHMAGQRHVDCSGREFGTNGSYPYPNGEISDVTDIEGPVPPDVVERVFYGFDTRFRQLPPGHLAVKLPNLGDVMSYCYTTWPSDYTYRRVGTEFFSNRRDLATHKGRAGTETMMITGLITPSHGSGSMRPIRTLAATATTPAQADGHYQLRFENAAGQLLATHRFNVPFVAEGNVGGPQPYMIVTTPPAGLARIRLVFDNATLATQSVSPNLPTVTLTTPNGGETLAGESATVRWTAADADGDRLRYTLQFSADGGGTWQTVAVDLTTTSYEIDLDWLPGTAQGMLRVVATDGFHTAQDQSNAPFTVAGHHPFPFIDRPADGQDFVGGQRVQLSGGAHDVENGLLSAAALTWRSDQDGLLGNGRDLSVAAGNLTAGSHRLSLTARDSDGNAATADVTIHIYRTPPARPNRLQIVPPILHFSFDLSQSLPLSATLTLDQLGDDPLTWTAHSDADWIAFDRTSGTTSTELIVTLDPTGLPLGQHSSVISLTTAAGDPATVTVPVALILTDDDRTGGRFPWPNSHDAPPATSLVLTLAEAVDPATVSAGTLSVHGEQTGRLPAVIAVEERDIIVVPVGLFHPNELVEVVLSDDIRTLTGHPLSAPLVWRFRIAPTAAGDGAFNDSTLQLGSTDTWQSTAVALGDLDGDGDLDAIQTATPHSTLWRNDGNGRFHAGGAPFGTQFTTVIALADLDADGDLDAISNAGVARNDGAGNFAPIGSPSIRSATALAVGDLDGDGDLDAFVGNQGANTVWLNDGAGALSDSGQRLLAYSFAGETTLTTQVVLADLDDDGDLDAYAADSLYRESTNFPQEWTDTIWINDGSGIFDSKRPIGGYDKDAVAIADLNDDGHLDIFMAGTFLRVLLNRGTGDLLFDSAYLPDHEQPAAFAARGDRVHLSDVDGDGDLDALVRDAGQVELWRNEEGFHFVGRTDLTPANDIALGDLDNDGDVDAYLARGLYPAEIWWNGEGPDAPPVEEPDHIIFIPLVRR